MFVPLRFKNEINISPIKWNSQKWNKKRNERESPLSAQKIIYFSVWIMKVFFFPPWRGKLVNTLTRQITTTNISRKGWTWQVNEHCDKEHKYRLWTRNLSWTEQRRFKDVGINFPFPIWIDCNVIRIIEYETFFF